LHPERGRIGGLGEGHGGVWRIHQDVLLVWGISCNDDGGHRRDRKYWLSCIRAFQVLFDGF
jgi:hypothetical protein